MSTSRPVEASLTSASSEPPSQVLSSSTAAPCSTCRLVMIVCASIAKPEPVATPAQEMLRTRRVICSAARVTLSRASCLRLLPQRPPRVRVERLDRRRRTRGRLRRDAKAQHGDRAADEHDHREREDPEPAAHPNCAWKAAKSVCAFSHVALTVAALASTHAKSSAA